MVAAYGGSAIAPSTHYAMAAPPPALESMSTAPGPKILLATVLTLMTCHRDCHMAQISLSPGSPAVQHSFLAWITMLCQAPCCHAVAAHTLCCRDASNALLDGTTWAIHILLGLPPHCLWAHPAS